MSTANPQQEVIAQSRDAKAVVLAGAGTGKTTTCVEWTRSLIASGVQPRHILMLTYTKKAASEMQKRVAPYLPRGEDGNPERVAAGTYHLVASKLIRHDPSGFGIAGSNFYTLDDSDTTSMWQNAFKSLGIMPKSETIHYCPRDIKDLVSLCVNTRKDAAQEMIDRYGDADGGTYKQVWDVYRRLKREVNGLDFDDLLEMLLIRLQTVPEYARMLRGRWRYVLVDEAQDNNQLQFDIMDAFNPEHLLLVGDLNQSIYAFRGANHRLMQTFVESAGVKTYELALNYRSTQNILDLANAVIAGQPHSLTLEAARTGSGTITGTQNPTLEAEAAGVTEWIQAQMAARVKAEEIAVIARSSRTLIALESILRQRNIAYRKYGGVSITDAKEVKDFLSVLRLTFAPRDRLALMRALMLFPGLGEGKAKAWLDKDSSPEDGLFMMGATDFPPQARELSTWLSYLGRVKTTGDAGEYLLQRFQPLLKSNFPKDFKDRHERLTVLVNSMRESDLSLVEFVDSFTVSPDTGNEHPEGHITLSTIHSVKGLEFDSVSIMGLSDLSMPHPRSRNSDEAMGEERRLLYVALTRARKVLRLSMAQSENGNFGQPTEFIPEELVDWKLGKSAIRPPSRDYEFSQETGYSDD